MSDVNFEIVEPGGAGRAPATPPALRPLPRPAQPISVRPGTPADLAWIDALQKANNHALGFMPFAALEGHLRKGNVFVAEPATVNSEQCSVNRSNPSGTSGSPDHSSLLTDHSPATPVGYCLASDRYMKRDDVGVVYQMCIAPGMRRGYVAANLLKGVWDTWPWGVKLCGCWCAQDLEASRFWEGCGFVPLAFRAGSPRKKSKSADGGEKDGRIHIYWQKRIRAGDGGPGDASGGVGVGGTPYWFPSETGSGAMMECRIVLPIPPGSHWSEAKPSVLPGVGELFDAIRAEREAVERAALKRLAPPEVTPGSPGSGGKPKLSRKERAAAKAQAAAAQAHRAQELAAADARAQAVRATAARGGLRFGPAPSSGAELAQRQAADAAQEKAAAAAAKREVVREAKRAAKQAGKKLKSKNDPALVRAARELRDKWLEAVQHDAGLLALGGGGSEGARAALDVSRELPEQASRFAPGGLSGGVRRVENARRIAAQRRVGQFRPCAGRHRRVPSAARPVSASVPSAGSGTEAAPVRVMV